MLKEIHRSGASLSGSVSRRDRSANQNVLTNARRNYDRYVELARSTALSGDTIATENFSQHADHYFRVMQKVRV